MADPSWRPLAGGVAQRRRERRLRSWYRHEQQTVRMALATFSHHSAPRRQTKAMAGEEGHELYYAPRRQLFSLEEEPGRGLPAPLSEVAGRQGKVERHVVEDLGELAPLVQILDLLVPQLVDTVLDALRIPERPMAVQVIEVPKILIDVIPGRSLVPEPQTAEQLVEVPTVLSPTRIALRIAEQIVGTPVPLGRGQRRVQGFFLRPTSTAPYSREERISERTVEQIVDIPVPGRGVSSRGGPHGSVPAVPGQSSTAFGGGHQDFLPEQVSTAFSGAEHVH